MADQLPATDQLRDIMDALEERRFMGQWGAARFLKNLKYKTELRFVEEILNRKDKGKPSALLGCTSASIQAAVLSAASAGVSFDPGRSHAYLVPYAGEAKFQLGYRGIIALAFMGGTLKDIQANLVRAKDTLFRDFTDEHGRQIQHEASRDADRGAVTHSYCVARFMSGGQHIEVVSAQELAAVEEVAKKKGGGMVWGSAFKGEMQKKVPVRRSSKFWPIDPDGHLARALRYDYQPGIDFERAETPDGGEVVVSPDQVLKLHATLTDFGLEDALAAGWLRSTAQARGYAQIEQLPASKFDEVLGKLKERAKIYVERAGAAS